MDAKRKPGLATARMIMTAYESDEFLPIIPYGPLGYGKSAYAIKVAALIHGNFEYYNYEAVKDCMVFHPKDFLKKCSEMEMDKRNPVLIWDDAGLWLHALDFQHPFVKSVAKYMNVARTDWGSIIYTTPWPTWIIKKVRGLPQCVIIKILKADMDLKPNPSDPTLLLRHKYRIARAYRSWITPDMKKSGVKTMHEDYFDAYLPDDFFEWYKPLRDKYAEIAKRMMAKALKKMNLESIEGDESERIGELQLDYSDRSTLF